MLRRRLITFVFLVLLCGVTTGVPAHAQTSGGFSIQAVIPENQVDKRQTYFDLRMSPGDEQSVGVVITNSRAEELVAEVRLNPASTGRNGLIVYTEPDVRDELMDVSVTDVAVLETGTVTVPAHSSKTVTINIKMPEEPVEGVILGGIAVSEAERENNAQESQGVSLKNKITYVIALKLTENDIALTPDFDLAAIRPELVNFRPAVTVTLRNKAARIVKDMDITAQMFRKDSDIVLRELICENAEMAPLSRGIFVIDWENEPLAQGTYRLRMTAEYAGETWVWDENFVIGGEANDLNKEAVGLPKNQTWMYLLLGAVVLTLVWFAAYRSGKRVNGGRTS